MTLERFVHVMTQKIVGKDVDDEIRQIFISLDVSCTGFVTLEDLKKAFKEAAPTVSAGIIEQAFREVDTNHDGRVSFKDFEKIMKNTIKS